MQCSACMQGEQGRASRAGRARQGEQGRLNSETELISSYLTLPQVVSDEYLAPRRAIAEKAGWDLSKAERLPQGGGGVPTVP